MYLIKKGATLYKIHDMSKHIVLEDFVAKNASRHVGHIRFPYMGNSTYSLTFNGENKGLYKVVSKKELEKA